MVSIWPWKGTDTSPSSFEKTLSTLSAKTASTSTRLDKLRQQARRFKALWTLYSIFIYILYATIDVLVLGWQSWSYWEYGAVLGGPFVVYIVRSVGGQIFDYRIQRTQSQLNSLIKQRDATIEQLKVATKYNSTQELLEKYGGDSSSPSTKSPVRKGGKRKEDNNNATTHENQQQQGQLQQRQADIVQRTGLPPPPTANIRRPPPQSFNDAGSQQVPPYGSPPPSSPDNYLQGKPLPPPPSANYIDQTSFAPNAFPPSSQGQYYDRNGGVPTWYDRLMDVLLGEDETSPKNRFVLICQNCRLVNGQAPPGIKTLHELGRWKCGSCGAWNGEESETKKVIDEIRKAEVIEREDDKEEYFDDDDEDDVEVKEEEEDEDEGEDEGEDEDEEDARDTTDEKEATEISTRTRSKKARK